MDQLINVAIICDIRDNTPTGVICADPLSGDIAYSTMDSVLSESIEILLDHKQFLLTDENIGRGKMIREETIRNTDSYYLIALNYSLPFPWRVLGVTATSGDVETVANDVFMRLQSKEDFENEE